MKKIISLLIVGLLVIGLSGCALAQSNDIYDEDKKEEYFKGLDEGELDAKKEVDYTKKDIEDKILDDMEEKLKEGMLGKFPVGIKFYSWSLDLDQSVLDEYLNFYWVCDMEYKENHTCTNMGTAIISQNLKVHSHHQSYNDRPDEETMTISLTAEFYYPDSLDDEVICMEAVYMDEDSNLLDGYSTGTCTNLGGKGTMGKKVEGYLLDGTKIVLDFTFSFEKAGNLQKVTVKEFDSNDVFVKATDITDSTVEEFITESNTEYLIVIEEHLDLEGNTYQLRYLLNKEDHIPVIKLTFVDENGFIPFDFIPITFNE